MPPENEKLAFHNDLLSDIPETDDAADVNEGGADIDLDLDPVTGADEGDSGEPQSQRTRGSDGKFQSRAEQAGADEEGEDPDDQPDSSPDDYVEPPARMPVEDQKLFHKLSKEGRDLVNRLAHEKDSRIGRATQQLADVNRRYGPIEKILAPRRAQFQRDGTSEVAVVKQLFDLSDYALREPLNFIRWFANENKLDLGNMGGMQPQQPQYVDPELKRRDDVIAAQQARLDALEGKVSSWDGAAQQRYQNQVHSELQSFRSATDKEGQSLHPYFDEVEEDMALLIDQGRANNLDDAYEKAVRLNPSTYERQRTREQATENRRRNEQARLHADKARRAASSLSGSSSSTVRRQTNGKGRSVAQAMSDAWDLQMGEDR